MSNAFEPPADSPERRDEAARCAIAAQVERIYARRPRGGAAETDTLCSLGFLCLSAGLSPRAAELFDQCLALNPNLPPAHSGLGLALQEQGRLAEAEAAHRRALALEPHSAERHCLLGGVCQAGAQDELAMHHYRQSLALDPRFATAHYKLGTLYLARGELAEAIECYRAAYALAPDHAAARFEESLALLLQGNFREGWPKYETRWQRHPPMPPWNFAAPLWLGKPALQDRTILLHAEQGLGDTIMFARYAALLARRGARVLLEVQPPLKPLLASLAPTVSVFARGEATGRYDFHCPLGSLPLACGTDADSIPAEAAYLRAPAEKSAAWRTRLSENKGFRVGLTWSGNSLHPGNAPRSLPLSQLAPLTETPGCCFYSLQREKSAADARLLASLPQVIDLASELGDFSDTAAIMENLDCVLTTDTSVAHVAGALGRPVWLALQAVPDWRWGLQRTDSPWYPTARLFRQEQRGDWSGVIGRLRAALKRAAVLR